MNQIGSLSRLGMSTALLGLAGAAPGQNEWLVDIAYSDPAGEINSLDDTATVTLWAAFDPANYAFNQSKLDVTADDDLDAGMWSDPRRILTGPGSKDGTINGEIVVGIIPAQFHNDNNHFADTANPIAAWTATWQTFDLHPRKVLVITDSVDYVIYIDKEGNAKTFVDELTEGVGQIIIVPAPGTLVMLFLSGSRMCARPRRRSTCP